MIDLFGFLFFNSLLFRTICLFLLGICIGSFLNVVIYRLPIMLQKTWRNQCLELLGAECSITPDNSHFNLLHPASHCPKCHNKIPFWTNIPILGYFMIAGKCIKCHVHISLRYPLVELITGLLFVATGFIESEYASLAGALIFVSVVICLILIDFDTFLLPDELTLPLVWLGLLFNLNGSICGGLSNAVIGAMIGYLILWGIYWIFKLITKKEGMGYGDFKFLSAIGAWLGWQNLLSVIIISSLTGILYAIIMRMTGRLLPNKPIPFGPFLGVAGLIVFFYGNRLIPLVIF
jgi:leader peptidase (prepilin peptidase)/N-methyltransferase